MFKRPIFSFNSIILDDVFSAEVLHGLNYSCQLLFIVTKKILNMQADPDHYFINCIHSLRERREYLCLERINPVLVFSHKIAWKLLFPFHLSELFSWVYTRCLLAVNFLACSKRSDSGERYRVKKAMKSRGGLGREVPLSPLLLPRFYFFALLFTSHRSPLSERLEQAINFSKCSTNQPRFLR